LSRTLRGLIYCAALCLAACASTNTTFTSTWKAPDANKIDPSGKTVAALVISPDKKRRRDAETYLTYELSVRGTRAVSAYTLTGLNNPPLDEIRAKFKDAGVNGVVVMRLVGHDKTTFSDPGGLSGSVYGTFGNYYSSYGMSINYSSGYEYTEQEVRIETLIYSLNPEKLLWAGTSRTSNPEGLQELVTEVSDAVSREVVKQGLVAKK
jgi:hypothetical protein